MAAAWIRWSSCPFQCKLFHNSIIPQFCHRLSHVGWGPNKDHGVQLLILRVYDSMILQFYSSTILWFTSCIGYPFSIMLLFCSCVCFLAVEILELWIQIVALWVWQLELILLNAPIYSDLFLVPGLYYCKNKMTSLTLFNPPLTPKDPTNPFGYCT